jgi:Recombination endonuclease VII
MGTFEWEEEYRKKHKKRLRRYNSQYYFDTKKQRRNTRKNSYLKRSFGITLEDYNNLLKKQNFSCAICFKSQKDLARDLSVDHDHKTGKIRGLLCNTCNTHAVPFVESHLNLLTNVKDYLNRNSL